MPTLDQLIEHQRGVVANEEQLLLERGLKPTTLLAGMTGPVTEQRAHLDVLLARKAAQDEAIATHEAAQRSHADDLVMLGSDLEAARRELADSVSAAIESLNAAWLAGEAYDKLLSERSAWLREVGMPAVHKDNDDDMVRFSTGGNASTAFGRPHLVLERREWHPVYPREVTQYVMAVVVAAHKPFNERRTSPLHELLDPLTRRPTPVQS